MSNTRTLYRQKLGRVWCVVTGSDGKYGYGTSALLFRSKKKGAVDQKGKPALEETHWMNRGDIQNAIRQLEIADDIMHEAEQRQSADKTA